MGITAAITGLITSLGVGSTVAGIGATVLEGAALGAGTSAIEGKNPLTGALTGGVGGAVTGGLGALAPGLSGTVDSFIGGSVGGLAGGEKPVQALEGGAVNAALTGVLGGKAGVSGSGGGPTSAAGVSAPSSVGFNPEVASQLSAPAVDGSAGTPDLAGGTSLPGSSGGGAGLPGSVGGGAATGDSSVAAGPTDAGTVAGLASPNAVGGTAPPSITSIAPGGLSGGSGASTAPTSLSTAGATDPTQLLPDSFSSGGVAAPAAGAGKVGILDNLTKNPTTLLAGVGLLGNVLGGNSLPSEAGVLKKQAAGDAQNAGQLESYLASGTLPQGLQVNIDTASNAAKATIRSQYAARGMSGSSAEAQDLSAVDSRATAEGAQIAMQLYSQGVQESQISSQIYEQLLQTQTAADTASSNAVANFAGALAGLGRPPTPVA